MTFNFPDNKTLKNGSIQNYYERNGRFYFEDIDISNPIDNIIQINGVAYYFTYLNGVSPGNKGSSAVLLKLYETQDFDLTSIEYDEPDLIIKISKSRKATNSKWADNKEKRFLKEIEALQECKKQKFQNVIELYQSGSCRIKNYYNDKFDEYLFYTMEFAEYDLKSYIENNHQKLTIDEKLSLCISICEGIKELYSLGYYHRDIKPDNIFIVDGVWKIGDLGLVDERNKINEIDKVAEAIGPKGWMSPESMNKFLCEGKNFEFKHNCIIDHQSDIFQLGKVFWYIFQHNTPIGSVKEKDFIIKSTRIYSVIKTMLSHSKSRRYKEVDEIIKLWRSLEKELFRKMVA